MGSTTNNEGQVAGLLRRDAGGQPAGDVHSAQGKPQPVGVAVQPEGFVFPNALLLGAAAGSILSIREENQGLDMFPGCILGKAAHQVQGMAGGIPDSRACPNRLQGIHVSDCIAAIRLTDIRALEIIGINGSRKRQDNEIPAIRHLGNHVHQAGLHLRKEGRIPCRHGAGKIHQVHIVINHVRRLCMDGRRAVQWCRRQGNQEQYHQQSKDWLTGSGHGMFL